MPIDALDLRHVFIPLAERVVVFPVLALARAEDPGAVGGGGAPETEVAVVGAGEEVFCVGGEFGGEDATGGGGLVWGGYCEWGGNWGLPLHAFGVVDVAGVAFPRAEDAERAVVGGCDDFLAGRGVVDVHDRGDMVLEDVERALELAHVEYVDVVVLVARGEVERLHRVPAEGVCAQRRGEFVHGGVRAQVVEDEAAVVAGGGEDAGFDLVEAHAGERVGADGEFGDGLVTGEIPDFDYGGGGGEGGGAAVVGDGVEGLGAEIRCEWGAPCDCVGVP